MIEREVKVTLEVRGPFLSRSSAMGGFGVDAVALRDDDGYAVLPGSQVRGRLREALTELFPEEVAFRESHFGPAVDLTQLGSPTLSREPWYFGDFRSTKLRSSRVKDRPLIRIAIEEATGAVKTGALLVTDCAVQPGDTEKLEGIVTILAESLEEIDAQYRKLLLALHWTPSVGSFRSVGYGRIESVQAEIHRTTNLKGVFPLPTLPFTDDGILSDHVTEAPGTDTSTEDSYKNRLSRHFVVTMDEAFCCGGRQHDRNVYRTLDFLTGSVLKGTIAQHLRRVTGIDGRQALEEAPSSASYGLICAKFSKLRFLAAFPVARGTRIRPLVTPLSLIKGTSNEVRDAARLDQPFTLCTGSSLNKSDKPIAPTFSIDWKSPLTTGWETSLVKPIKELRIHTAIDSASRRSKEEHLFAHELARAAHRTEKGIDAVDFIGEVILPSELSRLESDRIWEELETLFRDAVFRIGKTKARARITFAELDAKPSQQSCTTPLSNPKNQWVLVLQSPCLMLNPKTIQDDWSNGLDNSAEHYAEYFVGISKQTTGNTLPALKLVNHFRQESLHGGYLAYRTQQNKPYEPFWVTEAGSVFVVEATSGSTIEEAQSLIKEWLFLGLPLPLWAKERYGETFATNPFLPSDGFGEIVVNVPDQMDLALTGDQYQLLEDVKSPTL